MGKNNILEASDLTYAETARSNTQQHSTEEKSRIRHKERSHNTLTLNFLDLIDNFTLIPKYLRLQIILSFIGKKA